MKRDTALVLAVVALAAAAYFVAPADAPAASQPRRADAYHPAPAEKSTVTYRSEGGLSPIERFEVVIDGPGECLVRWQPRGGPLVEKRHPISDAQFQDLLDRLARAGFFEVESVPRSGYHADTATVTLALSIGEERNEVTIDGRRRATRDLGPVLEVFDGIRKAATPEPVGSGD